MANEYKGAVNITTGAEIADLNANGIVGLALGTPIASMSTGASDNDALVTKGYVDDSIGASYWQRVSTTLSPLNAGDTVDLGTGPAVGTSLSLSSFLGATTATMYGTNVATHIALGTSTVTGASGQNYSGCAVLSGDQNESKHNYSVVVGGQNNEINSDYSLIGCGIDNTISNAGAQLSAIIFGYNNTISSTSDGNVIITGVSAQITETAEFNIVAGGTDNTISGDSMLSSILGTTTGAIDDSDYSMIIGGSSATVSGGGDKNAILNGHVSYVSSTGDYNTVLNGSTITIGNVGTPSARSYSLAGGQSVTVDASYCFAYGRGMALSAGTDGCFVFGYNSGGTTTLSTDYTAYFFPGGTNGSVAINAIIAPEMPLHVGGGIISQVAEGTSMGSGDVLSTGLGASYGLLIVRESNSSKKSGVFRIEYQTIDTVSANAIFTTTKDNAGTYNVYWETDQWKVQNNVGSSRNIRAGFVGTN